MSLAELKRTVDQLPVSQRVRLADYLTKKDAHTDEARKARIARRMKAMDAGRKITQEQVFAIHESLKKIGL